MKLHIIKRCGVVCCGCTCVFGANRFMSEIRLTERLQIVFISVIKTNCIDGLEIYPLILDETS